MSRSIVEYFGDHEKYKCGYCGKEDSNYSRGLWAHSLTVQDYQALIDRGWRRSGQYCYKPTMELTCCPQYTIRCLATDLLLRKSHKKVLKRMQRFLSQGIRTKEQKGVRPNAPSLPEEPHIIPPKTARLSETVLERNFTENEPAEKCVGNKALHGEASGDSRVDETKTNKERLLECRKEGETNPVKKAKLKRIERKIEKLKKKGIDFVPRVKQAQPQKSLEDHLLEEASEKSCHNLEVTLIRSSPPCSEFRKSVAESHNLYKKYQAVIHGDKPSECTLSQYERFLVKSPLKPIKKADGSLDVYGSYHQHYRLDGQLIAVGVIDILPLCISSVYFFYDPDYQFLSLGTYASLRELTLTRSLSKTIQDLRWYYLGFYIHECPKMRYKGQYDPSFLVCPEAKTWQPIDKCIALLEKSKYSRLEPDPNKKDEMAEVNIDEVLVLCQSAAMTYKRFREFGTEEDDEREVVEYAGLVGSEVAKRMLLFRQ